MLEKGQGIPGEIRVAARHRDRRAVAVEERDEEDVAALQQVLTDLPQLARFICGQRGLARQRQRRRDLSRLLAHHVFETAVALRDEDPAGRAQRDAQDQHER
jgi:hypothetical protein